MADDAFEKGEVKVSSRKKTVSHAHKNSQDLLARMRANPWMVATIVLAVALLIVLFMRPGLGASISSQEAGQKVVEYLNNQVGGGVTLSSVSQEAGLFKVLVDYQSTSYPFYVTVDGSSFISQLTPFDGSTTGANPSEPVVIDESKLVGVPTKGQANAPITIIEFSDYQCPFCERFYSGAMPQIISEYIETGKAKLVYMNFPLTSIHPEAEPAARAALCFRKVKGNSDDAYFQFHDKLFENQGTLSDANYKQWARDLGANGSQFDSCLNSNEFADVVQAETDYGASIGVTGTPGFFINGVPLSGAQPFSAFKQIIDAQLAE